MKKSFSNLEECQGQKFVDYISGYDSNVLLIFEDGYLVLHAVQRYPEESLSIIDSRMTPAQLVSGSFYTSDLVEAGVLTEEECVMLKAKNKEEREKAQLQHERAQYEQLKKQFENT